MIQYYSEYKVLLVWSSEEFTTFLMSILNSRIISNLWISGGVYGVWLWVTASSRDRSGKHEAIHSVMNANVLWNLFFTYWLCWHSSFYSGSNNTRQSGSEVVNKLRYVFNPAEWNRKIRYMKTTANSHEPTH